MKRLLVSLALLIPVSLFIAGCGTSGGGHSGPPVGPPSKADLEKMNEMAKRHAEMAKKSGTAPGAKTPSAPEKK